MSTKLTVSLVAETLKKHRDISPATLREIVEELNEVSQPEDDKEPTPRVKQQYIVVTTTGELGWVLQIAETDAPHSVVDRIHQAAHSFNATKAGRLLPVKSLGEAVENVKRKHLKEAGVKVCTKLVVPIIKTTNVLPEAPTA